MIAAVAALGIAACAPQAKANEFGGAYIEATAGYDDVTGIADPTDVTYGASAGLNIPLGNVIVGPEVSVDNVFDRSDVGLSGRLGYNINDTVMPYVKVGYANYKDVASRELDGLRVGGGLEYNISNNAYIKAEYRYSDFERNIGKHGALAGFGFRF